MVAKASAASSTIEKRNMPSPFGRKALGPVCCTTTDSAQVFTDEWQAYDHILQAHATVAHGQKEWVRDDDGDGIREVHTNTIEGLWTTVRNFLRPFRGVHKRYLG
jgi:IS1 family transposase